MKSYLSKKHNILFAVILIVFFNVLIHTVAINLSSKDRDIIWEPDDNYHELIKAKNLSSCKKNCKGINNLLKYENKNLSTSQIANLDMYLHHNAVEYHYIKSILLVLINNFTSNWEDAHKILSYITTVLLIILIVININLYFNTRISLVASILILPYVQIKYGLHFSNGSDELASVFAFLSLIYLHKINIIRNFLSIIFSGLAIFSHPIGILMLLFNWIFIFIKNNFNFKKELLIYYIISALIVLIYFNIDLNYLKNNYSFISLYNNSELNFSSIKNIFIENIKNNSYFLYDINNLLNITILIIIYLFLKDDLKNILYKYHNLIPLIISSIFIIILSLIHYAPEASILTRMQQILTFTILCLYSVLIYEFLIKISYLKFKYYLITLCLVIFSLQSIYNISNLNNKIKSNRETLNLSLDTKKIHLIKEFAKDKKIVFKNNNTDKSSFKSIYYKFLLEGFNNEDVYLNEFLTNNDIDKLKLENFLLVIPSPILNNNLIYKEKRPNCFNINSFYKCIKRGWYGKSRTRMSDLLIYNNEKIQLISDYSNKIILNINNFNNDFFLTDINGNKIFIDKDNNQNYYINISKLDSNEIKFNLINSKYVKLNSLKTINTKNHNWPWDEKIKLIHNDGMIKRTFHFNLKNMIGKYYCENFELIDDSDSYLIINIACIK